MRSAMGLPRESVCCDICKIDETVPVCEAQSLYSEERFTLVRCRRCSLVYVNPRQEELAKHAQLAKTSGTAEIEEHQTRDEDVYRLMMDKIDGFCRRGSLLDVGCATGGLLREARNRGWQVAGVEPAQPLADLATRAYGLKVHGGSLEKARFPNASFDVVVMVHVIEHLYHPSRTVAEVFRILKPGGYLYSMTPDFHHYGVRIAQQFGFLHGHDRNDPTAHPYYFTPNTHASLVTRQGFRLISCGSPISGLFARRNGGEESWRNM